MGVDEGANASHRVRFIFWPLDPAPKSTTALTVLRFDNSLLNPVAGRGDDPPFAFPSLLPSPNTCPIPHAPYPQRTVSARLESRRAGNGPKHTPSHDVGGKDTHVLADRYLQPVPRCSVYSPRCATARELFVNKLWYRSLAKIEWLLYGGTQETPTAGSSPIAKLPQDLVEMIISYFIHDTRTLLACSLTCYSWYIVTVSHLHHSLTTDNNRDRRDDKHHWPGPLRKSYELGLLPLVRRFRIRLNVGYRNEFTPELLAGRNLHCFSALTNLQELGIDNLQISAFLPTIQQCFGHLSPTLRFLALKDPSGSRRQILYFIGLFPNLQDFKLHYPSPTDEEEGTADAELVPLSIPPLRGRLTLTCLTSENLVKDMITFFGGLRFRYMDLFRVKCVPLLLDACAETLETLRLYPTDVYGEDFSIMRDENELK